jgi:hypothetical protein
MEIAETVVMCLIPIVESILAYHSWFVNYVIALVRAFLERLAAVHEPEASPPIVSQVPNLAPARETGIDLMKRINGRTFSDCPSSEFLRQLASPTKG